MHTDLELIDNNKFSLSSGINFYQEPYTVNDQRTNLYWVEINRDEVKFDLKTFLKPKPLLEIVNNFVEDQTKNIVIAINTSQFFLSDSSNIPRSYAYNLNFKSGLPLQLPTNFRATLMTHKNKIIIKNLDAKGSIKIGNKNFKWHGSHNETTEKNSLKVYGIFDVDYLRLIKAHKKVFLDKESSLITCTDDELLIGIGLTEESVMVECISDKTLNLFGYLYIFRGPKTVLNKIKLNDLVTNLIVDRHRFKPNENAISLVSELPKRKLILKKTLKQHLVSRRGNDYQVLDTNYRKSWCIILEKDNKLIFFMNDARPLAANQNGLNIYELQDLLNIKFNYDKAYICDAGQSSKIIIWKKGSDLKNIGNLHYLSYEGEEPVWDGYNGRSVPSALLAFI